MGKICERDGRAAGTGSGGGATLVFSPERVAGAVAFHLVDEGIASRVCPRSVEAAAERLRGAGGVVVISRSLWTAMENRQRMEWLLASSSTSFRVTGGAGGMAVLT